MPARHERKQFISGGIYHIFNRGINKQEIFHSDDDFGYFENSLTLYLTSPDQLLEALGHSTNSLSQIQLKNLVQRSLFLKNYSEEINLHAYCFMPNHYHLLVQQSSERSISLFMKSLQTRYAMYYGKKYGRIGPLFQGRYKGILVENEAYYNTVLEYIHQNPAELKFGTQNPDTYLWSSKRART